MRGRKKTDLINQIFVASVLMRSRVKRGNRIVLTPPYGVVVWYGIRLNRYSPINAITACIVCVIWMILCRYVSRLSPFRIKRAKSRKEFSRVS